MSASVGDIIAITAVGSAFNQLIMFTQTYAVVSVTGVISDQDEQQQMLDAVRAGVGGGDLWETLYLACLPPQYTLEKFRAQKVRPSRISYVETPRGAAGTHASDAFTANVSAAIPLTTNLARRDQLAVKKLGPIPDPSDVALNGFLTAAYQVKMNLFAAGLLSTMVTAAPVITAFPVIVHRNPAVPVDSLTKYRPQGTVRVKGSRTVGRGK
jgi:hypothetical protein